MTAEFVRKVLAEHPGAACFTCSFQAEDVVLLDILRREREGIPVLFLDTGYHFPETLAYRDELARAWGLNLVNVRPVLSLEGHEARHGRLYETHKDLCCKLRKVEPLLAALEGFDVWFTGLRREQSPTRAGLEAVEEHFLPSGKALAKASPLAAWTAKEVWNYLRTHGIGYLPQYDRGYTSIGCEPCTSVPPDPDNPRSGRWAGQKLECGIHTF